MIENPRQAMCLLSQVELYRGKAPNRQSLHHLRCMRNFVACYEASGQVKWLKKFVPGLRVVDSIEKPLKMYCDNEPAVFYAHNNKSSGAAKHIDIKFYVVKEQIQDHTISLEYLSTKKMLADPLTKGLPPNVFREHLAGMGLRESL
jgi:hypothetical protein